MIERVASRFYQASLFTLPWIGVGVIMLGSGRDLGGGLQPSWLLLALATVVAILAWSRGRTVFGHRFSRMLVLSCGMLSAALALSLCGLWIVPGGGELSAALAKFAKQVVQLGIMAFFVMWPALWTAGLKRWRLTLILLVTAGIFQVGYGALQWVEYFYPLGLLEPLETIFTSNPAILSGSGELYLGNTFREVPRLRGTACEPLYLGNFLLMILPLSLAPWWPRRRQAALVAVFGLLLLLTWSRGAWLGLIFQVLVGLLLWWRMSRGQGGSDRFTVATMLKVVGSGMGLLALGTFVGVVAGWEGVLFPLQRLQQTFSGTDWSNLTRLYSMEAAWQAFLMSPIVGVGWGQFGWHFPALVDPMGLQSQFTWPVVNNFYLQVLCETGLVGFLVMAGLGGGLVRAVWRRLGSRDARGDWRSHLLLLITVSCSGVWMQMVSFSQYNLPHIWVVLGLLLAAVMEWDQGGVEDTPAEDSHG